MTMARYDFDSPELETPTAFIQWKGTDVCLDFECECGASGHVDADFVYTIKCPGCGKVWAMPHTVRLVPEADFNRQYHEPVTPEP